MPACPPLLTAPECAEALAALPLWRLADEGRAIARDLVFADFAAAFAFMAHVALLAERADHHPDWRNVWNRVEIGLTTHAAGGLTRRDIALAQAIDRVAGG
ncbi:MAG TPA: 4a-hydroxytetrahydrobiopterin dehydratase [Novosphingobium sp.]|nr:4a-hydroxytetrahydrobiopterin dehydratase [Novosphingobium sp.]HZV09723.1 4a-hydroxytetrahydrobiopterin dehydratase [Novosphingobium sp.]